jgi:hypothetical protein
MKIKPIHIDGFLVVAIACCGFSVSYLDSDESFKYVPALLRFWTIFGFGFMNAGCAALLFLRNKTYSEGLKSIPTTTIVTQPPAIAVQSQPIVTAQPQQQNQVEQPLKEK